MKHNPVQSHPVPHIKRPLIVLPKYVCFACSYIKGHNFLSAAVSNSANSLALSLLLLWSHEAQEHFTHCYQLCGLCTCIGIQGASGLANRQNRLKHFGASFANS